jgi:hypothetical protein
VFGVLCLVFGAVHDERAFGQAPPAPAELLTVELANGRKFTGHVDVRTNAERLVLRFEREGSILRRPIEWDRIARAIKGEQAIELAMLRELAESMKSQAAGRESGVGSRESGVGGQESGDREQETDDRHVMVTSVAVDPRLANWDGDVETDGLLLDVRSLDADGYLAAAGGLVEIELFAQQRRVFHHAPQSRGETLQRVERWTASVAAEDFGPSGFRLKLPFGAVHPEFDLDWNAVGLVHVKFTAPGHGVFEDSRDAVRIRPFAPLRGELQMSTDRRFVPTEGVGRRD